MTDIKEKTAIEAMSLNVLKTKFEDFDKTTVESAKNRIIDVIGCAIGGAKAAGNLALVDMVKDWGGKSESTIWIHGGKVPMRDAALVNSIMCRSFDYEPMMGEVSGKRLGSHISGTTVPTALAVGEMKGVDGKELITALLVGDDVANRILMAHDFDMYQGWDGIGTLTIFGATAIAGRLLGLNEVQLRNAFGIALNLTAGAIQSIWDGTTDFKLPQGAAAMNGIISAKLALGGWKGIEDALQSRFGYYALYTRGCTHPEMLTQDLGKIYYAENSFKQYPCCRAVHAMIDAALVVASKHDFNAENIEEVVIHGSSRSLNNFVGKPFQIRSFPQGDALFSLQYTCAVALLNRSVKLEHFTDTAIHDAQVNALIKKIKLVESPPSKQRGFEVRVKNKDGSEFSEYNAVAKGDPIVKPHSKEEIIAKFMGQVDFSKTITREKAKRLLGQLEKLDSLHKFDGIFKLAVA